MQLSRAHSSGNAEPSRQDGLSRKSPKSKACNGESGHSVAKSTITPSDESFSVTDGAR